MHLKQKTYILSKKTSKCCIVECFFLKQDYDEDIELKTIGMILLYVTICTTLEIYIRYRREMAYSVFTDDTSRFVDRFD